MGLQPAALLGSPTTLWQAPFQTVASGSAGFALNGAWRLLLLGDGSPTRHLELLSGLPLEVDVIAMAAEPADQPGAPVEINELQGPRRPLPAWPWRTSALLACQQAWGDMVGRAVTNLPMPKGMDQA